MSSNKQLTGPEMRCEIEQCLARIEDHFPREALTLRAYVHKLERRAAETGRRATDFERRAQ